MTRWIANWLLPLVLSSFPPMNSGPKSRSPIRFGSLARAELPGHPFHLPRILERSSPAGSWKTTGQWENNGPVFSPRKSAAKFGKLPICEIQVDLWSLFKAGDPNSCGLKPLQNDSKDEVWVWQSKSYCVCEWKYTKKIISYIDSVRTSMFGMYKGPTSKVRHGL